MKQFKPLGSSIALLCVMTALAGCPLVPGVVDPQLDVRPLAISFGTGSERESFTIFNEGGGTLEWTVREVMRVGPVQDDIWTAMDVPFLTLESDDGTVVSEDEVFGTVLEGSATTEIDQVELVINRGMLPTGTFAGFGVQVMTDTEVITVPLSLTVLSSLSVNPTFVTIPSNSNTATFNVNNLSNDSLNYTVRFLEDPEDAESVIDPPFFVTDFPAAGSVGPLGSSTVGITIDRTGLDPDSFEFYVLVESLNGMAVVTVSFGVGGVGVFNVTPDAISLQVNTFGTGDNPTSSFTIENPGTEAFDWSLSFEEIDLPGVPVSLPDFIRITPQSGGLASGRNQQVEIEILRSAVPEGGFAELNIVVTAEDVGVQSVELRVASTVGPRLSIRQEPPLREAGFLDFGTDSVVQTLGVGNTGGVGTTLQFALTTDRPELIILPSPATGSSTGFACNLAVYFSCYDWVDFPIVIDRSMMTPGAEFDGGEILITPVGPGSEDLDPIPVAVSITRAPLRIEGAINRSRPPNLMRFIFTLRNSVLEAIDTTDEDTLRDISFEITENDRVLDLDETNFFVEGPEGLTHNVVLLLDFSGSLHRAGEDDGVPNGEFIDEMVMASLDFISNKPPSYRLSVMEYHEKNQLNYTIHPFSTDETAIADSLINFELPAEERGPSEIYDALGAAIDALVAQDPSVIPFDDTDVRSIIFVTDGFDNSSAIGLSDVMSMAEDNRIRLYPIGFGDEVNNADLITLATATGGAANTVTEVNGIETFLGTASSTGEIWTDLARQIVLTYISLADGSATYNITANYREPNGTVVTGDFMRDALVFPGDQRAGQISLTTTGISDGRAEVFVRTDYVPRNIAQFRFRFIIPPEYRDNLTELSLLDTSRDNGLLRGWRRVDEGNGVITLVTEPENVLPVGSFGNLMRLTFTDLVPEDRIELGFRVDNTVYSNPNPDNTVNTKYFMYPGGAQNPDGLLVVQTPTGERTLTIAGAGESVAALQDMTFDPNAPNAFDRDEDGLPDFDDPAPDNDSIPGTIANPELLVFPVGTTQRTVRLTNNRLDAFTYTFETAGLAVPVVAAPLSGMLEPGEQVDVTITINRAGVPSGTYAIELPIDIDIEDLPTVVDLSIEVEA